MARLPARLPFPLGKFEFGHASEIFNIPVDVRSYKIEPRIKTVYVSADNRTFVINKASRSS